MWNYVEIGSENFELVEFSKASEIHFKIFKKNSMKITKDVASFVDSLKEETCKNEK